MLWVFQSLCSSGSQLQVEFELTHSHDFGAAGAAVQHRDGGGEHHAGSSGEGEEESDAETAPNEQGSGMHGAMQNAAVAQNKRGASNFSEKGGDG